MATDRYPGVDHVDVARTIPRLGGDPDGTWVALEDRRIVGYVRPRDDDLRVHPAYRRRGHGRRLVAAGRGIQRRRGLELLQLYVPQHLPASIVFAEALGFRYHSSLWRFDLDPAAVVPAPSFPPDVAVRPLRRDEDLERYVAFMNESFTGHPTPMSWTVEQVRHVHGLPDFDPSLILLAEAPGEGRIVGFAVLEWNAPTATAEASGAVGLIGVVPAWRGRGLGRELLRWSVGELRRRGLDRIELNVEAQNERATRLYRTHGFRHAIEWPHWVLPADDSP